MVCGSSAVNLKANVNNFCKYLPIFPIVTTMMMVGGKSQKKVNGGATSLNNQREVQTADGQLMIGNYASLGRACRDHYQHEQDEQDG